MGGRDDVWGSWDGHRGLDCAHDGVDRGVKTERLLDDILVERELAQALVSERWEVGAQLADLLLVELLNEVWGFGETEHHP